MKRVLGLILLFMFLGVTLANGYGGQTRTYYIAAVEENWDHAPSFTGGDPNPMTGVPYTDEEKVFVENFIGSIYKKSIYYEYDAGFTARKAKPAHFGLLGPVIRAQVGDTIVVYFKNMTTQPASMHPHGVFYDKNSEGAPYNDGNAQKADEVVPPGGQHKYVWKVPRRAGPGPRDPSSIVWLYHSHVDEPADTNAGLVGPIVITKKGWARRDGSPRGIDREFFSLFTVIDENASVHFAANAGGNNPVDEDFLESNLMHGINGRVYGDNTGYHMRVGERVRWYILSLGTEVDLHTPHWHGVTLLHNGQRVDVAEVLPASTKTYDLYPDNPGNWMFHCHVNDHLSAGMMTKFTVN